MSFGFLGIQFGWGLQMANMSAIYSYLGANADSLAILWLAAPVTGVIIQPLDRPIQRPLLDAAGPAASVYSGRRDSRLARPGADAQLSVGLDGGGTALGAGRNHQRQHAAVPRAGGGQFAGRTKRAGLRDSIAVHRPRRNHRLGAAVDDDQLVWRHLRRRAAGATFPHSVRLSFYIGAAAFMGAVLWTVFSTKEYPPSDSELATIRARKFDWTLGLGDIFALVFTCRAGGCGNWAWFNSSPGSGCSRCGFIFRPAVAKNIFHAAPGSPEMEAAGAWSGFCFAAYNAVCFIFSFVLLWGTKYTGPKLMHVLCLAVGALGLASVPLIRTNIIC
jgi:maltose/moltooligosaccharide transporter